MGYTSSGGPDGLGVITNTPSTTSDLNQLIALIARMGNYRKGDQAVRDAITGDELYEGLLFYRTDGNHLEQYDGSGWIIALKSGTYTPTLTNVSPGTGATIVGRYTIFYGRVTFEVDVTLGSSPSVTGAIFVSTPFTASTAVLQAGNFTALGPSGARQTGTVGFDSSTRVWMLRADNNFLSNTAWTWAATNRFSLTATYLLP